MTGFLNGIDVSHHNHEIDWGRVASAGIAFAYAKASEGNSLPDSRFAENWAGMKAAGIPRGAYHYYAVGDDPSVQAQNFISKVTLEPGDLPPMVDIETGSGEPDSQMRADLHSFLKTLVGHYGVGPMIYTGPYYWNAHFNASFSVYPLWVAEYGVSQPKPVTGWGGWTIWQHNQSGQVDGIAGNVDSDYFNGSMDQLKKFMVPA